MVHAEAKILEAELRKFLGRRNVGIEVIFGQRAPLLSLLFAIAPDEISAGEEHGRYRESRRKPNRPIAERPFLPPQLLSRQLPTTLRKGN